MQVNFLRENPVLDGMQQAQQLENQRARAELVDMEVQARREQARQDRAASEALNRIYATGEKLNSGEVNRRLAADPSLGGARRLQALKSAEEQDVSRQQMEAQARERDARAFKSYVDSGLYGAAAEQARRMGLNIPAEFWSNKEKVAALREKLEIEDKRAGINQKNAAAGASSALAASRKPDPYEDFTDAEGRVFRRNKADGKGDYIRDPEGNPIVVETKRGVAEVGADARRKIAELQARARTETGEARNRTMREIAEIQAQSREAVAAGRDSAAMGRTELQQQGATERNTETNATRESVARGNQGAALDRAEARAQGGRAGGRQSDREVRYEMAKKYGLTDQEAAGVAAGVTMTPGQRAAIAERIQRSVINDADPLTMRKRFPTPEAQREEIARRQADVLGEQPSGAPRALNRLAPQQAEGTPVAPKDAADVPRGQDGRVDHRQLVDGQVYLIPLKKGGQTMGRWNAQTGRFDEVN